jgi:hypothetical protein
MYKPITDYNSLLFTKLIAFVSEFKGKLGNIHINNELNSIIRVFTLISDKILLDHSTFCLNLHVGQSVILLHMTVHV